MKLTKAEKSVLRKAAEKPITGMELSRKEQECVWKLRDMSLLTIFGAPWGPRIDLQIFRTKIDITPLLQTMNSESSAENPT
jgi:hypothetical protein